MVLKILSFLAVLNLALSNPAPEPDPGIIIDVSQVVDGGAGGGHASRNGCVMSGKSYRDQDYIEESCVQLRCINGNWEFQGYIDINCGRCELYGDPHINTFEYHYVENAPCNKYIPIAGFTDSNTGFSILSQPGLSSPQDFGVNAEFKAGCNPGSPDTCVSEVTYYEPGVKVTLILPVDLMSGNCYPFGSSYPWGSPGCSTTQIIINEDHHTSDYIAPTITVPGIDGTVIVFVKNCEPHQPSAEHICHDIYIVGTKGYTVRLMVDPSYDMNYQLHIYASRHQLLGQVYGLCDVFTGRPVRDGFTCSNGTMIKDYNKLISEFAECWED